MKKKWYVVRRILMWFSHLFEPRAEGFKVKMFCPHCGSRLHYFGCKQYETLVDHVSDPNNIDGRPHRPSFACPTDWCAANYQKEVFYGQDGSAYVRKRKKGLEYKSAIGSWDEWCSRTMWIIRVGR